MTFTRKPVVLIVEDELLTRVALRRVLLGAGYEVLEAGDGAEALQVLATEQRQVDVVVADIVMPKVDGFELLDRIESEHPALPLVLTSGFFSRASIPAQTADRLAGFLDKPYSLVTLLEVIAKAIASPPRN